MIKILPLEKCAFVEIAHVAENMRDMDKKEIYATRWTEDPLEVAKTVQNTPSVGYMFFHDDVPVAIVGAVPQHPGVYSVFMFATPDFPKVGRVVTRFIRRVIIPTLVHQGSHRAHCLVLEEYTEVIRWLEFLGAIPEAKLERYGRNQENFVYMTWRRENVHVQQRTTP